MAPTWDEERRLGDTIAERQIQRAREAQKEYRDHNFEQERKKYHDKYMKQQLRDR
jgi:hypothetical protein